MRHSQRGITLIGWLFLLVPVAIVVYAGIRLTPIYLNYMRVTKALGQAVSEGKGADAGTAQLMRNSLEKRFDIEGIEHPTYKDVDIHREGDHWVAVIDYEDLAPMFGNVSLLVQFHKELQVP
ncbi:MAG TPA: DUF4845 domain-containing protein [Steroidobacteraceae bacterium]|jgi:hypothetical protein